MAEGFVNNNAINSIQISEITLGSGSLPASTTIAQSEFSFSDPTGYKRYIISLHTINTTSANYVGLTLAYDVDYTTKKVYVTLTRPTSNNHITPTVKAVVIDIPE